MLRKWNREFRAFMQYSKQKWDKRYPKFRQHIDGDKVAGYELVENIVKIPKRYYYFTSVNKLYPRIIENLPTNQFVIKAVLGNQGKRVLCIHRKKIGNKMMYRDILWSNNKDQFDMDIKALMKYIEKTMKKRQRSKGTAIIIEEFLGDPEWGLPVDYKVYTVYGKAKMASIFIRRGDDEYTNTFDRNWNPIPLKHIYKNPEELDYIEKATQLKPLPSPKVREQLIKTAEILADQHRAIFCRYDFYIVNNTIYFGEITPVCGDLNNFRLLEKPLEILFPWELRKDFRRNY